MSLARKVVVIGAVAVVGPLLLVAGAVFLGPRCSVEYARQTAVEVDLEQLQMRLDDYNHLNGSYPTTQQGLDALVTQPQSSPIPQRWSQHLRAIPEDPWHHRYEYRDLSSTPSLQYDVFSLGPDGAVSKDDIHLKP